MLTNLARASERMSRFFFLVALISFPKSLLAKPTECLLVQEESLYPNGAPEVGEENDGWRCLVDSSIYSIEGLAPGIYKNNGWTSGRTKLSASSTKLKKADAHSKNTLTVNQGALISAERVDANWRPDRKLRQRGRELVVKEGNPSLLVLRVIDQDGDAPPQSKEELSNKIFGTYGDSVNMVSDEQAASSRRVRPS
jgi:hypothetical protein